MKKTSTLVLCAALLSLGACQQDKYEYNNEKKGTLSFSNFSLNYSEDLNRLTKASEDADDSYMLYLYDESDAALVWSRNYGDIKADTKGISLPAGQYRLDVRSSASEVPAAKFSSPVYGASSKFEIRIGETTELGTITCTLLQTAVTVGYNDSFLESVTGNGSTTVEVSAGYPLEYKLNYVEDGAPKYERRTGYFAVNNGDNTTMTVTYKGSIDGKVQKMTTSVQNIKPRDWHIITFMKKVAESGNASFSIVIDGLVADAVLDNNMVAEEEGDRNDPNAPQGDGGIELVSTCEFDISKAVVVPVEGPFNLTMQAVVPNGARKFTVDISSTNEDFIASVNTVGGTTLNLINPSEASLGVFTIVPFPHGSELLGKTTIDFNLADAQTPLLAFKGTHGFTMNVTDNKGCRKSIKIELVVE